MTRMQQVAARPAQALDAAINLHPSAVLVSGNPISTFAPQLARANQLGIPVLMNDNGDPVQQKGTLYNIGLDSNA